MEERKERGAVSQGIEKSYFRRRNSVVAQPAHTPHIKQQHHQSGVGSSAPHWLPSTYSHTYDTWLLTSTMLNATSAAKRAW